MTHKFLLSRILQAALLMLTLYAPSRAQALAESEVVIRVDDLQIDASEFEAIFRAAMRHKFYHGRIPDAELIEFRERVVQDIVTQVIVHREAERLGLQPDREAIARDIEAFDAIDLIVVDLWENDLLFDPKGIVASAVETPIRDAPEVPHSG